MEESQSRIIKIPIHQSLVEPVMIAGAERELAITMATMACMVYLAGKDAVSLGISLGIWFVGIFFARLMAKVDAQLVKTLIRHLKHQDYYPATETFEAE